MRALLSASQVDKHFISVSRFEKKPAGTDAFLLIPHANRHGVGRLLLRPPANIGLWPTSMVFVLQNGFLDSACRLTPVQSFA